MQKKNISILLTISFLQGMVFYASIATLYRQAIGVSIFQVSLIECTSMLLTLLLEIPWGIIADHIGYRKTMIVCNLLYVLSKVIFWKADGFGMLMLERILLSIIISGLSGVDSSILYLSCGDEAYQKVFGRYQALGEAGMLLSTVIYTLFIGSDYRLAAWLTIIPYGTAALLSFHLTEVKPPLTSSLSHPFADFKHCLVHLKSVRGLIPLILCSALFGEVCHMITVFLNQLQYEQCGASASFIGIACLLCTLAGLMSTFSERFTRRWGERRGGGILLLTSAFCSLMLFFTSNVHLSCVYILLMSMTSALYFPLFASIENRAITINSRATALSIGSLLDNGISIGTNLLLGAIANIHLKITFLWSSVLCLMCLVIFLYAMRILFPTDKTATSA